MDSLLDEQHGVEMKSLLSPTQDTSTVPLVSAASTTADVDDDDDDDQTSSKAFLRSDDSEMTLRERSTGASKSAAKRFTKFVAKADFFPKAEEELTVHTDSGVALSIVTLVVIALLFASNLLAYLSPVTHEHMTVDALAGERLDIRLDIEFHALPCSLVKLDVMAVTGEHHEALAQNIDLTPVPASARFPQDGCRLAGFARVTKVAGNMHVAVGSVEAGSAHHRHKFSLRELKAFNSSHTVHALSFGAAYPGLISPLDGVTAVAAAGPTQYQYFIKVVPTTYAAEGAEPVATNQYSVTERATVIDTSAAAAGAGGIPSVFFVYDFSPFRVVIETARPPLSHFLVSVCAVIGGVLTVSGIVHSLYYHGTRAVAARRAARALQADLDGGHAGMQSLLSPR